LARLDLAQAGRPALRLPAGLDPALPQLGELHGRLELRPVRHLPAQHARDHRLYAGRHARFEFARRLRLRAPSVPRPRPAVRPLAQHTDAAGDRDADPAVPHLQDARLDQHLPATDRAELLRLAVLRLPAAPVLPELATRA